MNAFPCKSTQKMLPCHTSSRVVTTHTVGEFSFFEQYIKKIQQAFLLYPKFLASNTGLVNQIVLFSTESLFYQTDGPWSTGKEFYD